MQNVSSGSVRGRSRTVQIAAERAVEALECRLLLASTPYNGTPVSLPAVIQAENFDNGGEGVAYHDTTAANQGNVYRSTGVDIGPCSDGGAGYAIGWTLAGEWLKYTVKVGTAGKYDLGIRLAQNGNGGSFHVEVDGSNVTGSIASPNTGSWTNYQTVTKSGISLSAGTHVVRLVIDSIGSSGGAGNFNWLQFTQSQTTPPPSETPYTGSPFSVGSKIQATDFNNGGEGIAYHDTTSGNSGGVYRSTGVDIGATSDPGNGYAVGWTTAGEWLDYSVTIPTNGQYTVTARLASPAAGGKFHVEFGGVNKTGSVAIPNTGGWAAYQSVTSGAFSLTAGTYVMRVVIDANNTAGSAVNWNWFQLDSAGQTVTPPSGSTYQPDVTIRNYADSSYSGRGTVNTTGVGQILGQGTTFYPAMYDVQVFNSGSTADSFNVTATGSSLPQWRVWVFDSQAIGRSGGVDVTSAATSGSGWNTGVIQPGQSKDFRFEVGPSSVATAGSNYLVTLTAKSASDPSKMDVAKGTTTYDTSRSVALDRRNFGAAGPYEVDVRSEGNIADTYRITAPGSGAGYTVKYFNAASGGTDITSAVTGSGWVTPSLGNRASQVISVQLVSTDGKAHSITLTATSTADGSVSDYSVITVGQAVAAVPSTFVIGAFSQPTYLFNYWKNRGVNTMVQFDSNGGQDTVDTWTAAAVADGLKMIREPRANPSQDVGQANLLAWMQPDEPELRSDYSATTAAANYQAWKAANPSMPVLSNFAGGYVLGWQGNIDRSTYQAYISAADWGSTGIYPLSGWNRPDLLDASGRAIDRMQNLSQGQPQFAIIETSNQMGAWLPNGSPGPTATQVRAQIWDSVVHGAQGIIYFSQSFNPSFQYDGTPSDVSAEITTQDARLAAIGSALLSPIDPPSLGFSATSAALEATWRVYNGKKYFIVMNMSDQAVTNQSMTLTGAGSSGTATVQGESRSVSLSGGKIYDNFAPYEAHVYVI